MSEKRKTCSACYESNNLSVCMWECEREILWETRNNLWKSTRMFTLSVCACVWAWCVSAVFVWERFFFFFLVLFFIPLTPCNPKFISFFQFCQCGRVTDCFSNWHLTSHNGIFLSPFFCGRKPTQFAGLYIRGGNWSLSYSGLPQHLNTIKK